MEKLKVGDPTDILCACGCGQEILWKDSHKYRPVKYIYGHYANLTKGIASWNKGLTKETSPSIKRMSESRFGDKNSMKLLENREKSSIAHKGQVPWTKGKHHTEKTKQKISNTKLKNREKNRIAMSEAAIKRIINRGGVNPGFNRGRSGYFYSNKNKKEIYYASSYEFLAYKILEHSPEVVSFDRCKFSIFYHFDGKRRYIPDILVNYTGSLSEIIEVKASYQVDDLINQAKFKAAIEYCQQNNLKFSVWAEKELGVI